MKRIGRGIPAAAVLANGLSRHGAHCHCRGCRAIYAPNGLTRGHQVDCECSICVAVRYSEVRS